MLLYKYRHYWFVKSSHLLERPKSCRSVYMVRAQIYRTHTCHKYMGHDISNRLFCNFSFIIAMINRIPRRWNSGGRRLRETWGGPIRNRLCILGGPIRNRLPNLGGPIRNRLCILGGPIRKPIINKVTIWVKRVWKDGVFLGLGGLILGISLRLRLREIPRSSPGSPWKSPSFPSL